MTKLSIIAPIYNEEDNIAPLCTKLFETLSGLQHDFEIIIVNDGSNDRSLIELEVQAALHPEIIIIDLRRNYGQTAAMMAGIDHATGDIIIPIDGDLQNDPADIPRLLEKLEEGFDVVSGWRRDRKDAAFRRNFLSRVANRLISWVSGVHLHDYGCSLKAYRREVLKDVKLYGEMHRFIPIYATWLGARVTEIPVMHYPRLHGTSKYGLARVFKVVLDIIVIRFLDKYFTKPIHLFGGFGIISILVSFLSGAYMIYLKFFAGLSMIQTPLPLLTVMTFLMGVMSILLGLLAEMIVRTYFESQSKSTYLTRKTINLNSHGSK